MVEAEKTPDLSQLGRQWVYRRFGVPGLIGLAVLAAGAFVWINWDKVRESPGVASVVELIGREPVPKADPRRFTVMVARIAGDDGNDPFGDKIFDLLFNEFKGIQTLSLDRTLASDGRMGEVQQSEAAGVARDYLRKSGASVLIWGKMLDKDRKIARLFLMTSSTAQEVAGHQIAPVTGSTVSLPDVFWEDLAKVLRLAIAARWADFEQGHYVANRLPPFITAVDLLIKNSSGRPGWNDDARGETLIWLGVAQLTLGEQTGRDEPLRQAVDSYQSALIALPRERVPLDWAATQNNLGNALQTLGERESGTAGLEEAVAAYREALKEWTRERVPLDWAMTQNNLGNALATLGKRESGTAGLDEAVAAYREALKERTRERVPLQWAWTQENLGIVLCVLGQRENNAEVLRQSVLAYEEALSVYTPEDTPYYFEKATRSLAETRALLRSSEAAAAKGR